MENGIKGIRERDLAWEKSFSFPIRYCIYIIRENLFRFICKISTSGEGKIHVEDSLSLSALINYVEFNGYPSKEDSKYYVRRFDLKIRNHKYTYWREMSEREKENLL